VSQGLPVSFGWCGEHPRRTGSSRAKSFRSSTVWRLSSLARMAGSLAPSRVTGVFHRTSRCYIRSCYSSFTLKSNKNFSSQALPRYLHLNSAYVSPLFSLTIISSLFPFIFSIFLLLPSAACPISTTRALCLSVCLSLSLSLSLSLFLFLCAISLRTVSLGLHIYRSVGNFYGDQAIPLELADQVAWILYRNGEVILTITGACHTVASPSISHSLPLPLPPPSSASTSLVSALTSF
jgi:hypothetical protein